MIQLINDQNATEIAACLPQCPYYKFLASHKSMAALVDIASPFMHDAFVSSEMEWYVAGLLSQIADHVGGHFLHCLAYQTAMNSKTFIHSERSEIEFLYIASWYDASYLPVLANYARAISYAAWSATCKLVSRAHKHGDVKLVSLALDRLSFYEPSTWVTTNPVLEFEIGTARYNHLLGKPIDMEKLVRSIHEKGNKYHRRIFLWELSTFLPIAPELVAEMARAAEAGCENSPEIDRSS
jgi:hypothetical protein